MSELKSLFLDLVRTELVEFSVNHPGNRKASFILEKAYEVPEKSLVAAKEVCSSLSEAVQQFVNYEFTQGGSGFRKPSWL